MDGQRRRKKIQTDTFKPAKLKHEKKARATFSSVIILIIIRLLIAPKNEIVIRKRGTRRAWLLRFGGNLFQVGHDLICVVRRNFGLGQDFFYAIQQGLLLRR